MSDARVGLVIEDDHDIRELVRTVLTQAGFDVTVASSGAEGVLIAKTLNPDVITLDLGLPDIDGFEVSRQIREFSDAYIVMLTARTEELDTLIGLESGADDYLTKPFRPRAGPGQLPMQPRLSRLRHQSTATGIPSAVTSATTAWN
jgi:DNA-binding response OmpR family regulator